MQPVKVLLIDDDEDDYILTKKIFADIPEKENYSLSWINNYEEGINAMLKSHYDIYLVDYRLGKYTGIDLLHEAIKSNVDEPIIILTGKGDSKVDHSALEIGAADYLIKDQINPYTIERSLRYALKHTSSLKALKESENKFRIIFERSKEPFLIIHSAGKVVDINQAGANFFNYSREELLKLNNSDLYAKQSDHFIFTQKMEEKGAIHDFQTQLITKDKKLRTVAISSFLQIDQHATEELYYCIIHDLTNRKQIEQFSADGKKNTVSKSSTINLANEIRNPMSSINLSLEQLKLDLDGKDESINLYLDILQTNFEKINAAITNLIDANHNDELNLQPKSLITLLENSLDSIDYDENLYQVNIFRDFSENDLIVNIDERQISESIHSIMHFAMQSECDNITVTSFVKDNYACIEIKDDGSGLQKDQKNTTKPIKEISLLDAEKIIQDHRGRLATDHIPQEGSTYIISLPQVFN